MSLALGVDSSTQATKVELRHIESGRVVASGSAPHPPARPPLAEQDPNAWWEALAAAVDQLGVHRADVSAMAVAGQQHGLVLVDDSGAVLRPAKLWNDTTSATEAAAMVELLGREKWASGCGSVPVASFTITKLAWMARHEPDVLDHTAKIMLPHDYLTWRLTGHHVTDRGDASGTGWFDPSTGSYSAELLRSAIDDPEAWIGRLPEVLEHDHAAGELSAEAAAVLGLPQGIVVGAGTGDNMAAALGFGLQVGDIAMSLGTSGTVYAVSPDPTADASGLVAGFADAAGGYLPLVCTLNATRVTDTIALLMGTDAQGLGELALGAPSGFGGVTLVPYFDGERTPNLPDATGSILGLRTDTTREEIALAAHDGVLCGLFSGVDALAAAGVRTDGRLHLIGGGARSVAYQQRCADLRGAPIFVPAAGEAVATGAALQAAVVHAGEVSRDIADRWELAAALVIEPAPGSTGDEVRRAFAERTATG